MAARRAVTVSQARGDSGIPVIGHWRNARIAASCTASSAMWRSPTTRTRVARMRAPSARIVSATCLSAEFTPRTR